MEAMGCGEEAEQVRTQCADMEAQEMKLYATLKGQGRNTEWVERKEKEIEQIIRRVANEARGEMQQNMKNWGQIRGRVQFCAVYDVKRVMVNIGVHVTYVEVPSTGEIMKIEKEI